MFTHKKLIFGLFSILLAAGLFFGTRPQKCADGICTQQHRDAPTYGVPGVHPVGRRVLTMNEEPSLELTIWYSAVDGEENATSYPYQVKLPVVGAVTLATDASYAVPDAAYDLAAGPYPLVILSPGFAMSGSSYGWLAEHQASHGFVVLAPEHDEQMNPESDLWQGAVKRPQDIQAVLAFVDDQVKPGGSLAGLVDPEMVAVIGHSYGGYTALAAAGARIDSAGLTTHCQEAAQANHPAAWLCDMLLPNLPDTAALAGLDTLPDELWPDWSNPRVDAIVSMAGDAFFFGEAGLAELKQDHVAAAALAPDAVEFSKVTYATEGY